MNYIVVFTINGELKSIFFSYRDEVDVVFKDSTLIRNVDDVIRVMDTYFYPDNNSYVIRETLLDSKTFSEDNQAITEYLSRFLYE